MRRLTLCGLLIVFLAGCTPSAPVSTPTLSTNSAQDVDVETPTAAEQQPTLLPTSTIQVPPDASQFTVAEPSSPLSPTGPWLLLVARPIDQRSSYLWIANADGTGITRIGDEPLVSFSVAPADGDNPASQLAIITGKREALSAVYLNLTLQIVSLPSLETVATLSLTDANTEPEGAQASTGGIDTVAINEAIASSTPAWSPDGTELAFVAAINSSSADPYVYDIETQTVIPLVTDDGQTGRVEWSPDGRYLVFTNLVTNIRYPGAWPTNGIWAVNLDEDKVVPLYDPERIVKTGNDYDFLSNYESIYAWPSANSLILGSHSFGEEGNNIRVVDLRSGEISMILDECFHQVAYDRIHNLFLYNTCGALSDQKVILLTNGQRKTVDAIPAFGLWWDHWDDTDSFFSLTQYEGTFQISHDGRVTRIQVEDGSELLKRVPINHSPDGQWYFAIGYFIREAPQPGLWIWEASEAPDQISNEVVYNVLWSPDSKQFFFSTEDTLYQAHMPEREPLTLVQGIHVSRIEYVPGGWSNK